MNFSERERAIETAYGLTQQIDELLPEKKTQQYENVKRKPSKITKFRKMQPPKHVKAVSE